MAKQIPVFSFAIAAYAAIRREAAKPGDSAQAERPEPPDLMVQIWPRLLFDAQQPDPKAHAEIAAEAADGK